ncbi:MAG: ADP-ribose-binding protein [Patescibacteria group bacterium]|nr:ADP-ribose-binding protein [Patescibacteria group bacterium]MDE2439091.1 ADP-ribose-binding protein [Patescibacteria group bacterium]
MTKDIKITPLSEITGNLWDYYDREQFIICILTNGTVNSGKAVMGKGCALECKKRIPQAPRILAQCLVNYGNVVCRLSTFALSTTSPKSRILTFPTKHNYWEKADLKLIEQSALRLKEFAKANPDLIFILPRPGCGAGKLEWSQVKKCLLKVGFPSNVWIISKG